MEGNFFPGQLQAIAIIQTAVVGSLEILSSIFWPDLGPPFWYCYDGNRPYRNSDPIRLFIVDVISLIPLSKVLARIPPVAFA